MQKHARILFPLSLMLIAGFAHAGPVSSDFPVFWVAGDPSRIVGAFQFIAAVFGNGNTAGSLMFGAIKVAGMIGLLMALVTTVFKQEFQIGKWMIGIVVAMAMFEPTTSITIKSYFDETSAVVSPRVDIVDNVPVGIAYPAGVAGSMVKAISDQFLTWFQSGQGGPQVAGASGLMNSLQMLAKLEGIYDCSEGLICENLMNYMRDCSGTTSVQNVWTQPGSLALLLNSQVPGYTYYKQFDPTVTQVSGNGPGISGQYMPCSTLHSSQSAGTHIYQDIQNYFSNAADNGQTPFVNDLAAKFSAAQPGAAQADTFAAANDMANGLMTQLQAAQDQMSALQGYSNDLTAEIVLHRVAQAGMKARGTGTPAKAAELFSASFESARLKAYSDQAVQSSLFISFMTTAMNFFSFLFVAVAPLVIIMAVIVGLGGIRIYASWLVMGVWSQSWLPIAALISFYGETSFWSRLSDLQSTAQFSQANMDSLIDQIGASLYTTASMISAVPIITLSLLSGSVIAFSSMASKATGTDRDYGDSSKTPGDLYDASNAGASKKVTEGLGRVFSSAGGQIHNANTQDVASALTFRADQAISAAESDVKQKQLVVSEHEGSLVQAQQSLAKVRSETYSASQATSDSIAVSGSQKQTSGYLQTRDKSETQQAANTVSDSIGMGTTGQVGVSAFGSGIGVNVKSERAADHKTQAAESLTEQDKRQVQASREETAAKEEARRKSWEEGHQQSLQQAQSRVASESAGVDKAKSDLHSSSERLEHMRSQAGRMQSNVGEMVVAGLSGPDPATVKANMQQEARNTAREAGADPNAAWSKVDRAVQSAGGWSNDAAIMKGLTKAQMSGDVGAQAAAWGAAGAAASAAGHQEVGDAYREFGVALGSQGTQHNAAATSIDSTHIKSEKEIHGPSRSIDHSPGGPDVSADFDKEGKHLDKYHQQSQDAFDHSPVRQHINR